jgi:hypothetical protein
MGAKAQQLVRRVCLEQQGIRCGECGSAGSLHARVSFEAIRSILKQ